MKQNQMKAFGIREDGRNELVLTNDQVRSLWFLTKRDYDFKKRKLTEGEVYNESHKDKLSDGFCAQVDLSAFQWQLNNAAYLAYAIGKAYTSAIVMTPEMKQNHDAVLTEIANSIKPLKP